VAQAAYRDLSRNLRKETPRGAMPAALGGSLHSPAKRERPGFEGPGRTNSEASPSSPNERRIARE